MFFGALAFGTPCVTGQISVGSLANCSAGDVNFTNWSFSAPGYTGNATVQIEVPAPGDYGVDQEKITLKFLDPPLASTNFSLSYTATLTNGYEFDQVLQQFNSGFVPNNATATGVYNGVTVSTDGLSFADNFGQTVIPFAGSVNVVLTGHGANHAPPPPCGGTNPGLCGGGPLQSVEMDLSQAAVPEPVTMGLVGSGLLVFALTRKRQT
jgi:hypothetical protein